MSDLMDRIWMKQSPAGRTWAVYRLPDGVEYIRADVAEADKAEAVRAERLKASVHIRAAVAEADEWRRDYEKLREALGNRGRSNAIQYVKRLVAEVRFLRTRERQFAATLRAAPPRTNREQEGKE